ncbi:MAG: serine hydrolase [Thermomicrobiales bacterium]
MPYRTTPESVGHSRARMNRRRLLALAGGGLALAPGMPHALAAESATPVASPAPSFPIPSTLAADASPEFRAVAEAVVAAMQAHQVPGVALGILAGDREEHATFGVASMSSLQPVMPETVFQIGSLTKTFTGTTVWGLHDEGAIDIDALVRTYLPNLQTADPTVAEAVQVGNLLDHTAGWYGDEGFDTGNGDDALARYVDERLPELAQIFPLGAFFSYNNAGFSLLGRLIEVATGTTYEAAVADRVFGPLGLHDTTLDRDDVLRRPYADGHYFGPVNGRNVLAVQTPLMLPRSVDPAGGIWSTTRDVIRYARFHLAAKAGAASSQGAVVSNDSLVQMREPVVDAPGLPISMGRDWFVQEIDGLRIISHNGDTTGQHTEFFAIPELDIAFVMFTNSSSGAGAALQAVEAMVATYPGLSGLAGKVGLNNASLVTPGTPTVDLPAEALDEYVGRYADAGGAFTIAREGDGLAIGFASIAEPGALLTAITPPVSTATAPLAFTEKDAGVLRGIARIPFVRDDAGKVGWIASGLRLIPRVE